jgi:hypothetical protein
MRPSTTSSSSVSLWFGKLLPRPEVVFISQMLVIYVVIGVSLFNLTRGGTGDAQEGNLWIALLSSCLGYILPNPKVERACARAATLNQQQQQ